MYTLFTIPGSCSTGITVLLERLRLDYQLLILDEVHDYSSIVPTNQVPALKTEEGQILTEGGAIALYLLEKHGPHLLPATVEERAEFYRWLHFNYSTIHPAYAKVFATAWNENLASSVKVEIMQHLADKVSNLWTILERRLENNRYILGDGPTHVDYMAAIYSSWNNNLPEVNINIGPNVRRFVKDVSALPEFKAAYLAENVEFVPPPTR